MSNEYIVSWAEGMGRVMSGDYLFDITEKPGLGFDFEVIRYETPTGLSMKILDGHKLELTGAEEAACRAFCDAFIEEADFPVQAYDAETRVWAGTMMKSAALALEHAWVIGAQPDWPVAVFVGNSAASGDGPAEAGPWERVAAAITEQGKLIRWPGADDPRFVLYFTKAEWAAAPKPAHVFDVWDFKTKQWVEERSLAEAVAQAETEIHQVFGSDRAKVMESVPTLEMNTWSVQLEEAQARLADPAAPTPFLDAMLAELDGTGLSIEDLVRRVMEHNDAARLAKSGEIHGKMYRQLLAVRSAATVQAVDDVVRGLHKERGLYPWNQPYTEPEEE